MAKAYGEHTLHRRTTAANAKGRATICEYELSCKRWLKSEEKLTINSDKEVTGKAAQLRSGIMPFRLFTSPWTSKKNSESVVRYELRAPCAVQLWRLQLVNRAATVEAQSPISVYWSICYKNNKYIQIHSNRNNITIG